MGYVIFGAIGLYLLISIVVVGLTIRYAKKKGRSVSRWGWGALLVMYLIPFWDWIPTVVTHQYYCRKDAGFWVYKNVEQWKAENPGVMDVLVQNKDFPSTHEGDLDNYITTTFLNSRFNLVVKQRGPLFLHRWLREDLLIDKKNNEILARFVDFSTSQERRQAGWSGWKIWLDNRNCVGGLNKSIESSNWMNQFIGAKK